MIVSVGTENRLRRRISGRSFSGLSVGEVHATEHRRSPPDRKVGRYPLGFGGSCEDVRFTRGNVAFAALHIVGSNNSMAPWTGKTAPTPEQSAEVLNRTAAVMQSIHDTFAQARDEHNKAVVLLTQADMFDRPWSARRSPTTTRSSRSCRRSPARRRTSA